MANSSCPHVITIGDLSFEDICSRKAQNACEDCGDKVGALWCCLYKGCGFVGCGEKSADHSAKHFAGNQDHSLMINLKTARTWCHTCETEVFLSKSSTPPKQSRPFVAQSADSFDEKPLGLAGLQNLGNTCYMNAALQALSNCPPLTEYFLNASSVPQNNGQPNLASNYSKLITQMWHEKRPPYVTPTAVAYGIKTLCPVFRGATQQDAQEFLRCFLDQLHDELKIEYPKKEESDEIFQEEGQRADEDEESEQGISPYDVGVDSMNRDHEEEFETCDSGLSSEKSEASEKASLENHQSFESLSNVPLGNLHKFLADALASGEPKKQSAAYRSIISDVFDGRLLSSVQCFTCENVSSTKEAFQDLSLPIPNRDHITKLHTTTYGELAKSSTSLNSIASQQSQQGWMEWIFTWIWSLVWGPTVSLTDCLAAFFSADELKGDNMYSCGKCNKLRNGVKYSELLNLPEVLCIHLKRFRTEMFYSTKISSYVSFPMDGLDMAPFAHAHARDKVTTYELIGVICHQGTHACGHYTCYALNESDMQWYEYDDTFVTQVDAQTVANCEAYVLFYRKYSEEMIKRRMHAAELIERSKREHRASPSFFISRRWINRFNTFAEPGPIDNSDFVCSHGNLNPSLVDRITQDDFVLFSQSVWEYLRETFKGGPPLTKIEACQVCRNRRLKFVSKVFLMTTEKMQSQPHEQPLEPQEVEMSCAERTDDVEDSPEAAALNNLLDRVVLQMNSTHVTEDLMETEPSIEVDSALCSPIDSIASQDIASFTAATVDVADQKPKTSVQSRPQKSKRNRRHKKS